MAKQEASNDLPLPSTESESQVRPAGAIEPGALPPADLTSSPVPVAEEILARFEEHRYATHWGINE